MGFAELPANNEVKQSIGKFDFCEIYVEQWSKKMLGNNGEIDCIWP